MKTLIQGLLALWFFYQSYQQFKHGEIWWEKYFTHQSSPKHVTISI